MTARDRARAAGKRWAVRVGALPPDHRYTEGDMLYNHCCAWTRRHGKEVLDALNALAPPSGSTPSQGETLSTPRCSCGEVVLSDPEWCVVKTASAHTPLKCESVIPAGSRRPR